MCIKYITYRKHLVENLGFGGVPVPALAVVTTLLQGQPQDPIHPRESNGEDQRDKSRPGTSSDSMTLPRVASGDTHSSVMN